MPVGMALGGKLSKKSYRVYALCGDGEIQEGQIWEAAMFAGFHKLDNLCVIVDNNNLQTMEPSAMYALLIRLIKSLKASISM